MRFEPTGIARRAAIRPLIRAIDESCSDWIRLDVSAGVQELHLTADSDIAIALLVDVSFAHCSITPMDSPNLRTGQPVHVGGKCATFIGPQYQVDVVRHRAIDEQRYVESSSSVAEQRQKLFVIIGIAKDTFPSISAVDDMLNAAGNNLPADSRHRFAAPFVRKERNASAMRPTGCWAPAAVAYSLCGGQSPTRDSWGQSPRLPAISG